MMSMPSRRLHPSPAHASAPASASAPPASAPSKLAFSTPPASPSARATAAMRPCHLPPAFLTGLAAAMSPFSASVPSYIKNFWGVDARGRSLAARGGSEPRPGLAAAAAIARRRTQIAARRGVGGDKEHRLEQARAASSALRSAGDERPGGQSCSRRLRAPRPRGRRGRVLFDCAAPHRRTRFNGTSPLSVKKTLPRCQSHPQPTVSPTPNGTP